MTKWRIAGVVVALATGPMAACALGPSGEEVGRAEQAASDKLNSLEFPNASGTSRTYSDNPKIMLKKNKVKDLPFFTSLGTNGRACIHCHTPGDNWGISAADVQYRFSHPLDITNSDCLVSIQSCPQESNPAAYGLNDPIFRAVDGANSPKADLSTADARRAAFSMLLTKGLIRVGIAIPMSAEFTLAAVDDPYGYASAAELSLFRRPLPSTNLRLSSPVTHGNPHADAGAGPSPIVNAVMWDGRETLPNHDIVADLLDQANGATLGHAQAIAGLSPSTDQAIVDFETGLHTAQATDNAAGDLASSGANGGPEWLAANQPYYDGINDVLHGDSQTGARFDPNVFNVYGAWASSKTAAQAAIARGEVVFDTKAFTISRVGGLNDLPGVAASFTGSCTTCHDAPNYGHHSVKLPINIGLVGVDRRTRDQPLYTLQNKTSGATVQVTDPGRALITGKWADIGKFKGPILRGLAGRAPYFHNGSAATLADVVAFYDGRFGIGLSAQEKSDLVAFLQAL